MFSLFFLAQAYQTKKSTKNKIIFLQLNDRQGGGKNFLTLFLSLSHSLVLSLLLVEHLGGQYRFFFCLSFPLFFVRHIYRLKVILHTKLYLSECFRKRPMITIFSSASLIYVFIHAYIHTQLKPRQKIRERFIGRGEHCAETKHDKPTWRKVRERAKRNRINHWLELKFTNQLSFQGHFIDILNDSCILTSSFCLFVYA